MAERWLALTETDITRGEWTSPDRRAETVAEWSERWLSAGRRRWKPKTLVGCESSLRAHVLPRWGDTSIGAIDRAAVADWVTEMTGAGRGPDVVRLAVEALRGVLQVAVDEGALAVNPVTRPGLSRPRQRDLLVLTPDEIQSLAHEVEFPPRREAGHGARSVAAPSYPAFRTLVLVAAYAGLRAGEIGALRRDRVDLEGGVIRVEESLSDARGKLVFGLPKTHHRRAVPIPGTLVDELRRHMAARVGAEPEALLFTGVKGGPLRHEAFYARHFKPATERIGRPDLRFHDLRHTYAALLIAAGAHPRALMERMGHSSITVTLGVYGHLLPTLENEVTTRLDALISGTGPSRYCTYVARPKGDPEGID